MFAIFSTTNAKEVEVEGFFTSSWCVERGKFADCPLETILCGYENCHRDWNFGDKENQKLVIFNHDEGKAYPLDFTHLKKKHEIDHAINRNLVIVHGEFKSGKIMVKEIVSPPPPKKSFFKGCL